MAWYEDQQQGLALEFHDAVQTVIDSICVSPQQGARMGRTKYRYRLLGRFPFVIYYNELPDSIEIVAVAHGSRKPNYWHRTS